MRKKKSLFSLLLGAVIYYAIMPLASAQWSGGGFSDVLYRGPSDLITIIQDFTSPFLAVLLNTTPYEPFFFAKVLFLILLYVVVYYILKTIEFLGLQRNRGVLFIISSIISILAMRYLPENNFIIGMLLPYSTLGVAIITFLPFLIYFFFVHRGVPGTFGRRAAWSVYAVIFLVLWQSRATEMSHASNTIYVTGLILVITALIFDKSIHKYLGFTDFKRSINKAKLWNKIELRDKVDKLLRARERGLINDREYEQGMREIENAQRALSEE